MIGKKQKDHVSQRSSITRVGFLSLFSCIFSLLLVPETYHRPLLVPDNSSQRPITVLLVPDVPGGPDHHPPVLAARDHVVAAAGHVDGGDGALVATADPLDGLAALQVPQAEVAAAAADEDGAPVPSQAQQLLAKIWEG